MSGFPVIEGYRAELRRAAYTRLTDAETERQDEIDRGMVQSLAIEGLHGSPEVRALFAMLREERAPCGLVLQLVDRYVREQLVSA